MKNKIDLISPKEIVDLLEVQYGKAIWKRRHEPLDELILTILSQHTSDINSERAFKLLMDEFGDLETV